MVKKGKKNRWLPKDGAASTMNPDSVFIHFMILLGVIGTLAAAVATSWNGLLYVAEQQLLPENLRWLTPVMVDIPLVVLTLVRGAMKARGVRAKRVLGGLLAGIMFLTAFSSLANFLHTVAERSIDTIDGYLGASTNAVAPWLILALTEVLWLVATKLPDDLTVNVDDDLGELEATPVAAPSSDVVGIATAVAAAMAVMQQQQIAAPAAQAAPAQPYVEAQPASSGARDMEVEHLLAEGAAVRPSTIL